MYSFNLLIRFSNSLLISDIRHGDLQKKGLFHGLSFYIWEKSFTEKLHLSGIFNQDNVWLESKKKI